MYLKWKGICLSLETQGIISPPLQTNKQKKPTKQKISPHFEYYRFLSYIGITLPPAQKPSSSSDFS